MIRLRCQVPRPRRDARIKTALAGRRRAPQARLLTGVVCLSWLPACSDTSPAGWGDEVVLASLAGLEEVPESEDPLAEHRPESTDCSSIAGWYLEGERLEVDAGRCNYLALVEPALTEAPAGARLLTEISHYDLTAAESGEAHIALLLRDKVFWERTIPIPGEANVYPVDLTLSSDIAVGDRIGIHLHNHGQNTYSFAPLRALVPTTAR